MTRLIRTAISPVFAPVIVWRLIVNCAQICCRSRAIWARLAGLRTPVLLSCLRAVSVVDEFGCIHVSGRLPSPMLARLLRAASGQGGTAHSQSLTRLNAAMKLNGFKGATLSGAAITPTENGYVLTREPARRRIANRELQNPSLWDGRFWIDGGYSVEPAAGKLGALPKALRAAIATCSPSARPMLPMLTKDGALVAVGPYCPDGTPSKVVKSAVHARLLREFAPQPTKVD